jgi:exonuclease III
MLNSETLDIICITESWLKPATPDSVIVTNDVYSVFRKDRTDSPGGGVCIILNNKSVQAVKVDIAPEFSDLDIVCVDIIGTLLPIRLILGYRPPASDSSSESVIFIKHLIKCLNTLCSNVDASIAIVGDFNLPCINWSNLKFATDRDCCSSLFSMFSTRHCLSQLVNEPTRLNHVHNNNLLDIILTNDSFVCDVAVSTPFSTSDHCSVCFSLLCPVTACSIPDHEVRNFAEADWENINIFLTGCDWLSIFDSCETADQCSAAFYLKVNDAVRSFVPLKFFKSSHTYKHVNYPIHIQKLVRCKVAAWRRYKNFKTLNLLHKYKTISARLQKAIYAHVAKREEDIIKSGNLGKFFRYSNSKFSHKSSIGPLQDSNGNKTINPKDKAALLSKYFQTQFTNDNGILPGLARSSANNNFSSVVFTPVLVSRIIKKLNHRSAGGPDGIPPVFINKTCSSLCQPLAFLFQILFNEGCVPHIWRQALITSIFKKGRQYTPFKL